MKHAAPHSGPLVTLRFLGPNATPAQLVRAAAANHTCWFGAEARASGGEVRRTNGVTWAVTPTAMTIAFPRLSRSTAGETLDALVTECYRRGLKGASCWSLSPTHPPDLGARVAARGFEWGWRPHWMARDLHQPPPEFSVPPGLRIAVDDEGDWDVDDLPYYSREDTAVLRALARKRPRRTWHFGAWLDGRIVGHSVLFLTTGRLGVAGVYNVGVVPSARNQGVGKAVSLAACQFARALGCHHALLNSAANSLYEQIGFVSLGHGQTWWMHAPTLAAPPPTPAQISFAEAVGRGDLPALDALAPHLLPDDLDAPLPSGMPPMALAVRAWQPATAEWLAAKGATLDLLHAWDLGWKDRLPYLLSKSPDLVNRRTGPWQTTPLHEAAQRGDTELARLLLTANPDLDIQDTQFHSTPLGWAQHLQRPEIVALIEQDRAKDEARPGS